jgi:ElaB/YqjD/DUF883 family membrane-anchored ribosome-binding protein
MKLKRDVPRTAEEIAGELGRLVEDGRALLGEAVDRAPGKVQRLQEAFDRAPGKVQRLQEAFADGGDRLSDIQTSATRAAKRGAKYARRADDYVHDNPWPAVAAGLALGVLATLWWSQRR